MKSLLVYIVAALAAGFPARAQFAAQESLMLAPVGQYPDDPADSLYSAARAALAKQQYERAAGLFHQITSRYPNSSYASNAAYYEAFSRSRLGDMDNLREAYRILSSSTSRDARALRAQVCGFMVKKGDASCKQALISASDQKEPTDEGSARCPTEDDDNDMRIAALNALMQVDAEHALPILKQVLARRDACSVELRRKALFLVSQKGEPESADILLNSAHSDPDEDVRKQAVFWLSQVHDPRAVQMLDSLLLHSTDEEIREKAMFSLTQQHDHGSPMLRDFATRDGEPQELREKAIFWLGQSGNSDDQMWLRQQFSREKNEELKEKILFSVSQHREPDSGEWLVKIAADSSQSVEIRKKAIFWAGQGSASLDQLTGLYSRVQDQEIKEALIFAYSQRHEHAAVDELMTIAKTEKDPDLRKKAVFWLGQSHDPRVAQFLSELINK